jgi:pyruvate dehydrogenase E1 component alpha subunit
MRRDQDCLKRFRNQVSEAALLDLEQLEQVDREVAAVIDAAVGFARSGPMPDRAEVSSDVYVDY